MASSPVSLSAPYTLFPLTLPIHQTRAKDTEGGSYRACITSHVESRKRKRQTELAAAVDGEGVNIYDARSSKTVSSYAVPSTTRFACAPASTVRNDSKPGALRRTYAAISAPKKELVCWEEPLDTTDVETNIRKFTKTTGQQHAIYLHDLTPLKAPTDGKKVKGGLLAVFRDGSVRCYSEDLQDNFWGLELSAKTSSPSTEPSVLYAATTTLSIAKKVLLRGHPSLHAALDDATTILVAIVRVKAALTARIVAIPTGKKGRILHTVNLPTPEDADYTNSTFTLHFPSATLYHLTPESLQTFDLSKDVVSQTSQLPLSPSTSSDEHRPSMLRISSSTVLVSTGDNVSLYDTKYGSLQAQVPNQSSTNAITSSALTTMATIGAVFLTSYISELDLAVGYTQNGIIGIQFSHPKGAAPRTGGLLIDALCKGVRDISMEDKPMELEGQLAQRISDRQKQANITIERLKEAAEKKDVNGFDQIFCAFVGMKLDKVKKIGAPETALVKPENAFDFKLHLPKKANQPLPTSFVQSIMSMIFVASEDGESMAISFLPPYTLRILIESKNFPTASLPVKDALTSALIAYDPNLRIVDYFLHQLVEFSITEVVRAIESAILSTSAPIQNQMALLRTALTRLATFPTPAIVYTLKSLKSETQFLLTRLLENELLDYSDEIDESSKLGLDDIRTVSDLLTALVDAIGMSGLLIPETEELLETLSADVEDALIAVEEAADLKGLLEEMFRHVNWSSLAQEEELIKPKEQPAPVAPAPPAIENPEKIKHLEAKAAAKISRREARQAAADAGLPIPPLPPQTPRASKKSWAVSGEDPKKVPRVKKREIEAKAKARARQSDDARRKMLERRVTKRRLGAVGHKGHLKGLRVTPRELRKQGQPVPVDLGIGREGGLLPLGLIKKGVPEESRNRVEEMDEKAGLTMKGVFWREGLAAGVYSVESMVV